MNCWCGEVVSTPLHGTPAVCAACGRKYSVTRDFEAAWRALERRVERLEREVGELREKR